MDMLLKSIWNNPKERGFWGLYFGRSILLITGGLLTIFLPIFLYEIFSENFQYVILFYLLGSLVYGVLVAFGAQFLNKFGFKRALMLATVLGAIFHISLFSIEQFGFVKIIVPIAFLSLLLFRIFYWIPYHTDFAKFTNKKNRGKQVGMILATITIFSAFGPILAGWIIDHFGFAALFLISTILFVSAMAPFSIVPRTKEKFIWSYKQTWLHLVSSKNRHMVLGLMANGAENLVGLVVWPIFIFLLLDGNYLEVGALSSFIIAGTIVLQLLAGKYLDKMTKKEEMLKVGSVLISIGWVLKIFVVTAFHIFAAGLYHSLTKILTRTSIETMFYELAADSGHYVDEYTVLREMAISAGKVIASVLVILVSIYFPIQWTFAIAATAAILLNTFYLKNNEEELGVHESV